MPHWAIRSCTVAGAVTFLLLHPAALTVPGGIAAELPTPSQSSAATDDLLALEDVSPAFLGMYRKVMEIEAEIRQYSDRYGVDYDLARAVCLWESGGNAALTSWAGARGYFQVMPATFRALRVETNIEAGVKYLAQMIKQFEREDYALAAYNGGPRNVSRRRPMRLETLQYILGVGHYRTVLKMHEPSIRRHAQDLRLEVVGEDDDWWPIAKRLGRSLVELRLHNPFLANLFPHLRAGQLIAYPPEPREDLLIDDDGDLAYETRHGDNYLHLALALDVDRDELREANALWRLQVVPAGMQLQIPLDWEGKHTVHRVRAGEALDEIAEALDSAPWRIIRDNGLFWDEELKEGTLLRVRPAPPRPTFVVHRVIRGDTLGAIARRYRTTIRAIQSANQMGRRTLIRIGQRLQVPLPGR